MRQKPMQLWEHRMKLCSGCKKELNWMEKVDCLEELEYKNKISFWRKFRSKVYCEECEVEKWWQEVKDYAIIKQNVEEYENT